jgi:hypothetical protein
VSVTTRADAILGEGSINILPGCGQSYDVALSRTERCIGRMVAPRRGRSDLRAACRRSRGRGVPLHLRSQAFLGDRLAAIGHLHCAATTLVGTRHADVVSTLASTRCESGGWTERLGTVPTSQWSCESHCNTAEFSPNSDRGQRCICWRRRYLGVVMPPTTGRVLNCPITPRNRV